MDVCTCDGEANFVTYSEADKRTAVRGMDGDRVEALLEAVQHDGASAIANLAKRALLRLLHSFASHAVNPSDPLAIPPTPAIFAAILAQPRLFNDLETATLAIRLASVLAPAHFLGRARVRLRHELAVKADDLAPFEHIATRTQQKRIKPMEPEAALKWFRSIAPHAQSPNPQVLGIQMQADAFRLAVTMEQDVLAKIHRVIEDRLQSGQKITAAPRDIAKILTDAGLTAQSGTSRSKMSTGAYARLAFRTPMMESYRNGAWEEFSHPDMAVDFPVWQYIGIPDGRERKGPYPERPDHHRWFGKYFDRSVRFVDVRGREARDVVNCRCDFLPIYRKEWAKRLAAGAVITKLAA